MAVIVDPDNLDRTQIIFGTSNQEISIRPVGSLVSSALNLRTDLTTTSGTLFITGSAAEFVTWGVVPGSVVDIFTGVDAGHWVVGSVDGETRITIDSSEHPNTVFTGSGGHTYSVYSGSGGTATDGLTEQALYSFAKEEWRTDTSLFGGDDLIRHPFPFEAITREQMEVGGLTAHANWDYNNRDNDHTKKKVRTGGWAHKNTAGTTLNQYAGIITLGSVDSDAQVYYQQTNAVAAPSNFAFPGVVNEPVLIFTSGSTDFRSYLKLFVRKKYRTYAGSQISDIGVTSLETIVNRFPLAHAADAAIADLDGAIIGDGTYREQSGSIVTGTDGVKVSGTLGFTSAGSDFITSEVQPGDTLNITTGGDIGYFTILTASSPTVLTCSADADFTGWTTGESGRTFSITTTNVVLPRTEGTIVTGSSATTGIISSSIGGLGEVVAGDMVIITESGSNRGVYKVVSKTNNNVLVLNTTDHTFPTQSVGNIDYKIVKPGMYFQYKQDDITISSTGILMFTGSNRTVTRSLGSWATDGVTVGSVVTFAATTNNNGSFTVLTGSGAALQFVSTDVITTEEAASATTTAYDAFKRSVAGTTYAFHWRLFGNDATLADCYQFAQHQLRQPTNIDYGPVSSSRGDVTDTLLTFASPTGVSKDLYIDNLAAVDTNNITWTDATGDLRTEAFVAAGSISFNDNLQTDASAVYVMFFTNDDAGDNSGRDYGTPTAIIVNDNNGVAISGSVSAQSSVSFTFDYDGNVQRGAASAGTDAPVTIVGIGLDTAQFVIVQGTIARSKANNFSLVSALERNYANA